jgi:hypothetical protein
MPPSNVVSTFTGTQCIEPRADPLPRQQSKQASTALVHLQRKKINRRSAANPWPRCVAANDKARQKSEKFHLQPTSKQSNSCSPGSNPRNYTTPHFEHNPTIQIVQLVSWEFCYHLGPPFPRVNCTLTAPQRAADLSTRRARISRALKTLNYTVVAESPGGNKCGRFST